MGEFLITFSSLFYNLFSTYVAILVATFVQYRRVIKNFHFFSEKEPHYLYTVEEKFYILKTG